MENSSSGDRQERSGQNRQGQRGGRRRQNNRGSNRNSGDGNSSNRRPRNGGDSRQGGGQREYRPSNRGRRQPVQKKTFLQKVLSFLGLGGDSNSDSASKPQPSKSSTDSSSNRERGNRRSEDKTEVTSTRLYVGNLDYKTTNADLEKHFTQIGTVKSAELVINRRTQQSKGFAFVEMGSIEEARKAVSTYHNEDFMGRRMLVNGAKSQGAGGEGSDRNSGDRNRRDGRESSSNDRQSRGDRNERGNRGDRGDRQRSERREEPRRVKKEETPVVITSARLKLDNLDYEVGEEELEELFKGIGVVVSTEVVANPETHQSRGYGFVEMSHIDEAQRAVDILNNKDFMGRKLNLSGAEDKKPAATETTSEEETTSEDPEKTQETATPTVES
ncbi:MAG: RNA-binding protein [Verrucomicrobiales bacterium]|nr:RNA-binding protein [Verrucomicrobiales bacterium]